jgi:hypothetical protein
LGPRGAGGDGRAARTLQRRDATGVIEMLMRIDDQPNVFDAKAERSNAVGDERRRLWQPSVDEDRPGVGGDEHR